LRRGGRRYLGNPLRRAIDPALSPLLAYLGLIGAVQGRPLQLFEGAARFAKYQTKEGIAQATCARKMNAKGRRKQYS